MRACACGCAMARFGGLALRPSCKALEDNDDAAAAAVDTTADAVVKPDWNTFNGARGTSRMRTGSAVVFLLLPFSSDMVSKCRK